jgi:hypothetical protein
MICSQDEIKVQANPRSKGVKREDERGEGNERLIK